MRKLSILGFWCLKGSWTSSPWILRSHSISQKSKPSLWGLSLQLRVILQIGTNIEFEPKAWTREAVFSLHEEDSQGSQRVMHLCKERLRSSTLSSWDLGGAGGAEVRPRWHSLVLHVPPQVALDVVEEICAEMALTCPEAFHEYVIFVVTNKGEWPRGSLQRWYYQ